MIHILAGLVYLVLLVWLGASVSWRKFWQQQAEDNEKEAGIWKDVAGSRLSQVNVAEAKVKHLNKQLAITTDAADEAVKEFRRAAAERDEARKQAKDLEFAQHQLRVIRDYLLGTSVYTDQAGTVDTLEPIATGSE
jgi:hypothetical protein